MKRFRSVTALGAVSLLLLAGCSSAGSDGGSGDVELNYWMWDDTQVPLYQACVDDFEAAHPGVTVKITQTAWAQYWQNLSTQVTAGTGPDVFVNQISYFRQYASTNQLLDLSQAESDVDFDAFKPGLADRWVYDGKRLGLPKDWDTVGFLYDSKAATKAGYSADDMNALTWNPDDGGTFGKFIRSTSVDSAGRTGDDPAFDSSDVAVYGFYPEWADGATGQNGWGNLAAANGFEFFTDPADPASVDFSSPALVETAGWIQKQIEAGYMPRFDETSSLGTQAVLESGNVASSFAGSWMASTYLGDDESIDFAFAPVPEGPEGRKAATNSLADSVWTGTKHPEEATGLVAYLASSDCQSKVGDFGKIFPATTAGTDAALAAWKKDGIDPTPFVSVVDAGDTYLIPAFEKSAEISVAVQDAMQNIAQGADPEKELKAANDAVKALF
ncbi:ABC transporter substrate-binding protein [Isoptericola sp. NPDC057191]|uniref:ABC transporter substrate-binding protein n=1 Tax=Isoptericola sp. NPDC057191 TaxID=3346041 RepID=UPI003626929A